MNTKLFLIASSLLMVMNGVNVGQAMEYWEPETETVQDEAENKSELAQTNDSLQEESRDFIKIINILNTDENGTNKYELDKEHFDFCIAEACKHLTKYSQDFIELSKADVQDELCYNKFIRMLKATTGSKLSNAIKNAIENTDFDWESEKGEALQKILDKYNIESILELLQNILKDKFKIEKLLDQEYDKQGRALYDMRAELNDRKIELERQNEELQHFSDLSNR